MRLFVITKKKNSFERNNNSGKLKIRNVSYFAAAPTLQEVTPDIQDAFTSRSAPVIARAQQCHNEEMRRLKLPWWKKLWDEDELEGTGERLKADENEQLNF